MCNNSTGRDDRTFPDCYAFEYNCVCTYPVIPFKDNIFVVVRAFFAVCYGYHGAIQNICAVVACYNRHSRAKHNIITKNYLCAR